MAGQVDPDAIVTRADFGSALTLARELAGLSVRELSARAAVPSATLGGYLSGRHLPPASQMDVLRKILLSCGIADPSQLRRWASALARVRQATDARVGRGPPPYRGLEPYSSDDGALFFGRESATRTLVEQLRALGHDPGPSHGMLAVVGSSGSGKSSLLRAGVSVAVKSGALNGAARRWDVALTTPPTSGDEIAAAGDDGRHPERRKLLIVDQLEELFTACTPEQRRHFLQMIGRLDPVRTLVVFGMRADFYAAAAAEPCLLPVLQHAQFLLGPMTEAELRSAITGPARAVGATVDDGLVELVLTELKARGGDQGAHDTGVLPFLSHALLATWDRAQRNSLTVAGYRAVGGVHAAIRQTAEQSFLRLSPGEQDLARRIFLRLVNVDADAIFTRRRMAIDELPGLVEVGDEAAVRTVLDAFIADRLLTAHADAIQLSHEALLSAWPRLRQWCEADKSALAVHRQLTEAANTWRAAGRDTTLLAGGVPLATFNDWANDPVHRPQMNLLERDFLDAATAAASAEARRERRRTRRLRRLVAALSVVALLAAASAVQTVAAKRAAIAARNAATSREVAIESARLAATDPGLAAQLAVAAYRISPTVDARSAVIDATATDIPTRLLGPSGVTGIALSADGKTLAVTHADDGSVHLYSVTGRTLNALAVIPGATPVTQLFAIAFSPSGGLLAAGGADKTVRLWNVADPGKPSLVAELHGLTDTVQAIAFSPDSHTLAADGGMQPVRRWNIADPTRPTPLPGLAVSGDPALQAISYSPDGTLLVAAGDAGTFATWQTAATPQPQPRITTLGTSAITSLAFSPDGHTIAAGAKDGDVHLLNPGQDGGLTETHPPLTGFTSWVNTVAFSPDGQRLAAGSSDNTAQLWDTTTWTATADVPHPGPVTAIAISPGDHTLLTAAADGAVRAWALPVPGISGLGGGVFDVGYGAGDRDLAVVTSGTSGSASLWNLTDPARPTRVGVVPSPAAFGPVAGAGALRTDGKLLAAANRQAAIQLFDTSNPAAPQPLGAPLTGASPLIEQMRFSPTGHLLAAGDDAGQVHLWDVTDPKHPSVLAALQGQKSIILDQAFSPDGHLLATASADNTVWLWDLTNPAHPTKVATLGGFANYAYTVAFTPDGHTLIAGSADHTIRLWDVTTPANARPLGEPLTGPNNYIYSLAISPDGTQLAAASTGNAVWLWNIRNPKTPVLQASLHTAKAPLFTISYSPDGAHLAAGGAGQAVYFFDPTATAATATICAAVGQPITQQEWAQYVPGQRYDAPCR